jgi:membrane protein
MFKSWYNKYFKQIVAFLRKVRLFKSQVPLWDVVVILYQKMTDPSLHHQASAIAYSFTLSLFPALLFLFSLIPFVASQFNIPDLSSQILVLLKEGIPLGIYEFVAPTVRDIIDNPRTDVLSFGFLFALYAATSGVAEMMHTFNMNYKFSEKRGFFRKRLIAAGLAFLFAFLLIIAVLVLLVGELVIHFLQNYSFLNDLFLYYSLVFVRYLVTFLAFYLGISYIYYIAPAVKSGWRLFSWGSLFASIGAIASTQGFSYYLSHFATYNKLYGSIGTIIALMVWLYVLAWILLIGFTLNAGISEARIEHEADEKLKYKLLEDMEGDK